MSGWAGWARRQGLRVVGGVAVVGAGAVGATSVAVLIDEYRHRRNPALAHPAVTLRAASTWHAPLVLDDRPETRWAKDVAKGLDGTVELNVVYQEGQSLGMILKGNQVLKVLDCVPSGGSPALDAGVREGMQLRSIGGRPVTAFSTVDEVRAAVADASVVVWTDEYEASVGKRNMFQDVHTTKMSVHIVADVAHESIELPSSYNPFNKQPKEADEAALRYDVPPSALAAGAVAAPLSVCPATREWASYIVAHPASPGRMMLLDLIRACFGDHIAGVLTRFGLWQPWMFLLSTEQWRILLAPHLPADRPARVLDVGAGRDVLPEYRPLFPGGVTATELSWIQIAWLRLVDGVQAVKCELPTRELPGAPFDAVMMLNLLDCVEDGAAMLKAAREVLAPGGVLVVSLPLPLCQMWESGDPRPTPLFVGTGEEEVRWAAGAWCRQGGKKWESDAADLLRWLEREGWRPLTLSRAPYLFCGARAGMPFHTLDTSLVVCGRGEAAAADDGPEPRLARGS